MKKLTEQEFRTMMATDGAVGLTPAQFSWLTPAQFRGLTPAQFRWLTPAQFSWLTPDQFRGLTPDQFSWLTPDQFRGLTPAQFSWLTPDQFRGLTPAQIATHKKIWDSVPVVDHLYSSILADIKAEKIILDQRTYGPDDASPTMNICGTPMCIAGHTVNRGGSAGYALKEKYGFPTAAALIHAKSRPDVSKPRYDSCPTEWTLAYIETRAAEELK